MKSPAEIMLNYESRHDNVNCKRDLVLLSNISSWTHTVCIVLHCICPLIKLGWVHEGNYTTVKGTDSSNQRPVDFLHTMKKALW